MNYKRYHCSILSTVPQARCQDRALGRGLKDRTKSTIKNFSFLMFKTSVFELLDHNSKNLDKINAFRT